MKKIIALLLAFVMVLSMTACTKKDPGADKPETSEPETSNSPAVADPAVEDAEDEGLVHTFTQYGNARIKIVGAEAAKNDEGEDLLRVYYDYTNTDDTANGHTPRLVLDFLSITQDGEECETFYFSNDDENAIPEDLNPNLDIQPGCTNRNTINIRWNPNGGVVKVSCFIIVGSWMYSENDVEPFEFEIDPKNLMGAPEPFELPAITNPTYTSSMSASGKFDFPDDSDVSINGIELTKDRDGRDLIRVNLTVTNKGEEERTAAMLAGVTLYQDGVSLPYTIYFDVDDEDVRADNEAYEANEVAPGDTVECCALFYPRTKSPVEAVIENPNSKLSLGACFDLQSLYDAAAAAAAEAEAAAAAAAEAASAADKALMAEIVGVWDRTDDWPEHITFNADLTGVHDMITELYPFTYTVTDGVLYLTYDDGSTAEYKVSISGNDMVLIDSLFDEEQPFARASAE